MDQNILMYGFALLLVFVLVRLLFAPLRYAFAVLYRVAIGGVLLYALNLVGSFAGLYMPINAVSALSVGYLGLPGVILLFALKRVLF